MRMVAFNISNWAIWKPRMEDFLCCKDLEGPLLGASAKPEKMSTDERKILDRKTVGYIHQWICDNVYLVAYDPRRHQGMTLRRRRSRHPRASSPLDRRRRRMPSFTIPSEDLISPRHISQGLRARGVIFPIFSFIMNLFSPHVFKRAFAYLLPSLLGH